MRLLIFVLMIAVLPLAGTTHSLPSLPEVKISISNPTGQERFAEDIVVPFAELRKLVPQINAGSLVVIVGNDDLPSQVDDLDGDGKADELVFQIDLKPWETRLVHVMYGEPDTVYRLRGDYSKQTYALFANKIEGLGWESSKNAWRLYFDPRNAIDLYGKRRDTMFLDFAATPEYAYHADTVNGRDVFRIGNALGIGAVGAWVNGKLVKVSDVSSRSWKIISNGPVRSIIEISYEGWRIDGKNITLHSRIVQWARDRGFFHTVTADGADAITFTTGLTRHDRASMFRSQANISPGWLATYGEQVVETGPTPTKELMGTNLGLLIMLLANKPSAAQDDLNYLMTFPLEKNSARWYVAAAWDQEGMNDRMTYGSSTYPLEKAPDPSPALKTQNDFLKWVGEKSLELASPAVLKLLP